MPTFAYTARDEDGKPSSGTVVAASAGEAGKLLRADKKYPTTVRPVASANDPLSASNSSASAENSAARYGTPKLSRADVIQFSTQLAIMVETGMLLTEALDSIASNASKH